jgi:hypothetical protein
MDEKLAESSFFRDDGIMSVAFRQEEVSVPPPRPPGVKCLAPGQAWEGRKANAIDRT